MEFHRLFLVYFNLHMYKDSHIFASSLTLSIPDIVLSEPSVGDNKRNLRPYKTSVYWFSALLHFGNIFYIFIYDIFYMH